jgi:uncharacterized membrane-anchored protein YhcB (DUF1043 family)
MYVNHLRKEILDLSGELTNSQIKKWKAFKANLFEGIAYYETLFRTTSFFVNDKNKIQKQLEGFKIDLDEIAIPELVK